MKYTVKNFKIFDEKGVTFDIAPITMLTGCNCSGKSSLVKSMMVLGEYLAKVKSYLNTVSREDKLSALAQPIDFAAGVKDTGGFDNVLNEKNTNGKITFQYTVDSQYLMEEVTVTLIFGKDENDPFNRNGKLEEITFQRVDNSLFYKGSYVNGTFLHVLVDLSAIQDIFMNVAIDSVLIGIEHEILWRSDRDYIIELSEIGYENNKNRLDALKNNRNQLKSKIPNYYPVLNNKITYKQGQLFSQYLTEDSFSDNIAALHKYKTVFYLPWLKFLDGVEKNRVRSVVETVLESVELSDDELFDLNFVLDDFENSEFDKFVDYYKFYESKEFQHQLQSENKTNAGPTEHTFWLLFAGNFNDLKGATCISNINSKDGWSVLLPSLYDKSELPKMYFPLLYVILANLYCKIDDDFAAYSRRYRKFIDNGENPASEHYYNPLYETMQEYFEKLWEELVVDSPVALSDMQYIGSTRATAQRLYSFDNQELDLNRKIKSYMDAKNVFSERFNARSQYLMKYVPYFQKRFDKRLDKNETDTNEMFDAIDSFMSRWLSKLDLCDSFNVDTVSVNGVSVGYSISFTKNGKSRSIADEGYGCIQLFSVLLAVQNALYQSAIDVMNENKDIIECLIAIEEPENHLHPKLQSLLADMFLEAYQMMDLRFIIESHSEYLIRKSQLIVAENYNTEEGLRNNPFKVYYIPSDDKPYDLQYTPSGRFANKFGEGFFDEAAMLDMAIIQKEFEIKKKQILNN